MSLHHLHLLLQQQPKELVLQLLLLWRGRSALGDAPEEGRHDAVDVQLLRAGMHLLGRCQGGRVNIGQVGRQHKLLLLRRGWHHARCVGHGKRSLRMHGYLLG